MTTADTLDSRGSSNVVLVSQRCRPHLHFKSAHRTYNCRDKGMTFLPICQWICLHLMGNENIRFSGGTLEDLLLVLQDLPPTLHKYATLEQLIEICKPLRFQGYC